jgi:hypothetical protein
MLVTLRSSYRTPAVPEGRGIEYIDMDIDMWQSTEVTALRHHCYPDEAAGTETADKYVLQVALRVNSALSRLFRPPLSPRTGSMGWRGIHIPHP